MFLISDYTYLIYLTPFYLFLWSASVVDVANRFSQTHSIYDCNLLTLRFHVHKVEAKNKYSFKLSEQKNSLTRFSFLIAWLSFHSGKLSVKEQYYSCFIIFKSKFSKSLIPWPPSFERD